MRTVAGTRPLPDQKLCPKCETWKPRDEEHFYRTNGRWQSRCKICTIAKIRDAQGKYVDRVREMKDNQPCADCGVRYRFFQLDYDHRPGVEKKGILSRMVSGGYRWETLMAEIAKCDLICANCHRMRTHLRSKGLDGIPAMA